MCTVATCATQISPPPLLTQPVSTNCCPKLPICPRPGLAVPPSRVHTPIRKFRPPYACLCCCWRPSSDPAYRVVWFSLKARHLLPRPAWIDHGGQEILIGVPRAHTSSQVKEKEKQRRRWQRKCVPRKISASPRALQRNGPFCLRQQNPWCVSRSPCVGDTGAPT